MPTPPTTRASRSRFSSPAVVGDAGAGARSSNSAATVNANNGSGSSRGRDGKGKGKGKGKESNAANNSNSAPGSAPRPSSTERSRRFMESWIEPERARLTSFQEDGLLRQGVLETMEPLGTRPKPSMIRKLVGMAREGSPTTAGGKKKKIILKRKGGTSTGNNDAVGSAPGSSELSPPPSSTMADMASTPLAAASSPTPATEESLGQSTDYRSQGAQHEMQKTSSSKKPAGGASAPATLPEPLPLPLIARQNSSPTPTPTPKVEQLDTPTFLPLSDTPLLPDPVKQSIEELRLSHLPTTPRSVRSIASTYDSEDDYFKRDSSIQSTSQLSMPSKVAASTAVADHMRSASAAPDPELDQAASGSSNNPISQTQQQLGPQYTEAELTRIMQQRDSVALAVRRGVVEALEHHCYVEAYALRLSFNHNQANARFLLQTEAVFRQSISREAAGEWARKLKPYKDEGAIDHTALKYFVPEAKTDKDFDFATHQPLQAPYAHLVSIDLTEVRNPNNNLKCSAASMREEQSTMQQNQDEGEDLSRETQAEVDEAEPERVATPPRKRQKTQQRDSSTARNASTPTASARARAARNMNGASKAPAAAAVPASPLRSKTRAGSNVSDVSTLSSIRTMSPIYDFGKGATTAKAAQASDDREAAEGMAVEEDEDSGEAEDVQMQDGPAGSVGSGAAGVAGAAGAAGAAGVDASADAPANYSTSSSGLRRAPARKTRNARPNYYLAVPPEDPSASSSNKSSTDPPFHSNHISQPVTTTNSHSTKPHQHDHNAAASPSAALSAHKSRSSKKSKKGMPNFTPKEPAEPETPVGPEAKLPSRREIRDETERLTKEFRSESYMRVDSVRGTSPPERPETASSSSSLSSVPDVDVAGFEPEPEPEQEEAVAQKGRVTGARATRANKRTQDDVEEYATPFSEDFGPNAASGTGANSRAATPRPAKKQKTITRRVKQSPMKIRGPVAGGAVPSRSYNRMSPCMKSPALTNAVENDDFCSFCGGNGNLVCCDGCQRAYHYMDHTPVVDPNEDSAWFCWDCMVKRDPSLVGEYKGPFGALMTNLDKQPAKAFILPTDIREYFEGVRTGVDGEFVEFVPPVKGKKKKDLEDKEKFDFFQVVDKEDKPILCHSCHGSAATDRAILPCSSCGLWWHADCLDPPRTLPPNPRTFLCPCHVDDLLLKVPAQLGPAHKFRKIKGSSDIVYGFRRGNVNNGYIEIDDDESDGAAAAPVRMRDPSSWGQSYRVRSSGVRDDFVSKVGGRKRPRKPQPRAQRLPATDYAEDAEDRYEAALNIMAFSRKARADRGTDDVKFSSRPLGVFEGNDGVFISDRHIEAASPTELEQMEAQLRRVSKAIRAEKRKRGGDDAVSEPGPTRRKITHDGDVEVPNTQAEQHIDLSTAVNVSETGSNHDLPMSAQAGCAQTGLRPLDGASSTGNVPAAEAQGAAKAIHQEASQAAEEAAIENKPSATAKPLSDVANQQSTVPPTADKEAIEIGADKNALATANIEDVVDQAADVALTPVSDIAKDDTEVLKTQPTQNGVETLEMTIPDRPTSPIDADTMNLD